jgi:hypothetical protein
MAKLEITGMDVMTMTQVVRKLENKGGQKIGLQFLPFYDSPTEETMWDIVRAVNPMADFRAVDGEAKLVGRQAFDRAYADVVSIAEKERFNASDLRKIKEAGMLPVVDGQTSLIAEFGRQAKKKVVDALQRRKDAIDNRLEWMQINALLGKIEYSGKVKFSVDYGVPNAGIVPSTLWSDTTNSNPLEDIITWIKKVEDESGITPDTIIMSTTVLNYIRKNTKLQDIVKYTGPFLSNAAAKKLIEDNAEVTVILYNTRYTNEAGDTASRFLAENKIIMLPSTVQIGDTARVAHPLANYTPGYYTWQDEKKDPYGLEVGVGLDAFPRIMHPEVLLNAVVY